MAIFAVSNNNGGTPQSLSTAFKTLLGIAGATGATTLRRAWLYEFEIGATDVPNATDCPINWDVSVQTTAGTATTLTPQPMDIGGGDAAALAVYQGNYTVEPTVTANSSLFFLPLNQRASQKIAFKDMQSSIISPAVNLKGPACRAKSPNYSSTASWHAYVQE